MIQDLINLNGGNLARPTKFTVLLEPPGSISSDSKVFDVLCKTFNIPEVTQEAIELKVKGHSISIPGRVNQQHEIQMTFYLDEDHILRKVLYDWLASCDDRYYGLLSAESQATVEQPLGTLTAYGNSFCEDNSVIKYYFENVFPVSVSGVEFNTTGVQEVSEFSATFAYYRYSHTETASPDADDGYDARLD